MAGLHDSWNAAFEELKTGLTLDSSYVKVWSCCDRWFADCYAHVKRVKPNTRWYTLWHGRWCWRLSSTCSC